MSLILSLSVSFCLFLSRFVLFCLVLSLSVSFCFSLSLAFPFVFFLSSSFSLSRHNNALNLNKSTILLSKCKHFFYPMKEVLRSFGNVTSEEVTSLLQEVKLSQTDISDDNEEEERNTKKRSLLHQSLGNQKYQWHAVTWLYSLMSGLYSSFSVNPDISWYCLIYIYKIGS